MHQIAHHRYTFEKYVELEEFSDTKHEVWSRGPTGWASAAFGPGEHIRLDAVAADLGVDEVYEAARGA